VAVAGALAYVTSGSLRVIDVSDPAAPREVGAYNTDGFAQDVAVVGTLAYVAAGNAGLQVIDVSDPTAPRQVGYSGTPSEAKGVAVLGDRAYVAASDGLRVIDISYPSPGMPVLGACDTPGWAVDVAVDEIPPASCVAFIAASGAGLRVIDTLNPAAPRDVGAYDGAGETRGVAVAQRDPASWIVYLADFSAGLVILRYTPPPPRIWLPLVARN
jgi:hypothetical protein